MLPAESPTKLPARAQRDGNKPISRTADWMEQRTVQACGSRPVSSPNQQKVKKRRRKFRKLRRGRGGRPSKSDNGKVGSEFKILQTNIRGFSSKKESLIAVINNVQPSCITINETGLRGNNKVNLPGYFSFSKNRTERIMGGVHYQIKKCPNMPFK